ncbi:MAG: hypothetical protein IT258_17475, partial [Saprospiraceae bacterium]|nr:hypothetical protein [Saprospiraceae bacterium]
MKTFPIVKTNWLFALLLCCAMLPQTIWAQCPNDNTAINTNPSNLPCPGGETLITGMEAGQFIRVNVVSGNEYTFETCGLSDSGFDTEMTIYRDDNGLFIDHNDDDCGTDSRITFTATFTGVVRVLIDSSGCVSGGPEETSILGTCTAVSTPANDDCATPTPLACGTTLPGTTVGATPDFGFPNCGVTGLLAPGVFYSFTGLAGQTSILLDNCVGSDNHAIRVYTGPCGNPVCVAAEVNSCGNSFTFNTTAGTNYLVYISTSGIGFEGSFNITLTCPPPPPANDDCATPTALTCGTTLPGTTVGATPDFGFPNCGVTGVLAPGVFYSFTGQAGQTSILLSNCVGNNSNIIRVYTGSCGSPTCVAAEVNACGTPFTFSTTAGTNYLVYIATGGIGFEGTFNITLTCPPPSACDILNINFLGNPGACNDNGTPNDASDDFFTQNIQASFINRPTTGSLQIVPGGDQIGTYSIPVAQIVGNSHIFNAVQLKADGTPSVITMNFTDDPACSETKTGTTVQPCSASAPSCDIIGFSFANIGPCNDNGTPSNPADDFFEVDVDVLYSNSFPASFSTVQLVGTDVIGTYSVNGQSGTNLTASFLDVKLRADGQATDLVGQLTVSFVGVSCSLPGTGPAVNSCSNGAPSCEVIGFSFANIGPCNDNGTPNDPADDFFKADVDVLYSNSTVGASISIVDFGLNTAMIMNAQVGTNLTAHFVNFSMLANGQAANLLAGLKLGATPLCQAPGTGPAVNSCSVSPPVLTCPVPLTVACANEVPPANPASVTETHSCPGTVTITHLGDVNSNIFCINRLTITRTYQGTDLCGNTATCTQTITVNDQTPPTVTCPANLNFSCASQVPVVDFTIINSIGVADNCTGGLGISRSFIGEAITNQTCPNRFTLTRTFRGGDACNNTVTCTQTITVNDQTPPTMTCPPNVTVSCFENIPAVNPNAITNVSENCGGSVTLQHVSDASGPDGICDNDFTITRTYRATDACSNAATCTQTIIIRDQTPPTITCAAQTTPLNCPATPVFTPPTASDNCVGNVAITFNDVTVPINNCPGTFTTTRTWTATDPCGNTATCARSITVQDVTPPPVPANTASTVACPALAIAPVPPVVIDACAGAITPTGPVVTNLPNPLTCEGTRTFTFTFRDCSGNTSQWSHTYTIEREPFFITVPNGTATVACPDDTDIAPATPTVTSNCGEVLTPVLLSIGPKPGCEGQRQLIYRYTDCEGNFADWLFTYNVEYQDFVIPASETESVECPILATQPTPPVVFDNCGKLLTPIGPVITSTDNAQACEASRQYAWTYKDCEGNTHVWSKTYHFLYSADFFTFSDETNVVACLSYAVQPFPPTLYDACGNEIKAALTNVTEDIAASGCNGWRRFDFLYTDCGGHSHPWSFTYEINDNEAPLGTCPSGNGGAIGNNTPVSVSVTNLSCIEEVPCPEDYDFSEKIEELLVAGNYFDVCSGNDLTVTLESSSDLWQCADPDGDGIYSFGRTFHFRIADLCGNEYPGGCEITYSGECLPIETFRPDAWGIAGGAPGSFMNNADLVIIEDMLTYGPVVLGGNNRSLT